jgi:ABC-type multidrug transport system fused ATPase/permease subunit
MVIKKTIKQNRFRLIFTLTLILAESILGIMFPLFIGKAITSVLNSEVTGIWYLGILGIGMIVMGGFRRMLDSRFYARIYTRLSSETVKHLPENDYSKKSARLSMLKEMVLFAENQLPELITHSIGLVGVMIIIATLNIYIFIGTIITGCLITGIYLLNGNKTILYNTQFNNELENQVDILTTNRQSGIKQHLLKLMRWNIRLSDIETINYSLSWIIMMALLLLSIQLSANGNDIKYGVLFALIMYVYQYIESMVSLPLYYQEWLRLKEITQRIQVFDT